MPRRPSAAVGLRLSEREASNEALELDVETAPDRIESGSRVLERGCLVRELLSERDESRVGREEVERDAPVGTAAVRGDRRTSQIGWLKRDGRVR